MKGFLLFVVGGIVGAVLTFLFAGAVMTGVGAGVGIATGLKAGACLTVEAAKNQGFINEAQVNEVLSAAGRLIADTGSEIPDITDGDASCQQFVAELKSASEQK